MRALFSTPNFLRSSDSFLVLPVTTGAKIPRGRPLSIRLSLRYFLFTFIARDRRKLSLIKEKVSSHRKKNETFDKANLSTASADFVTKRLILFDCMIPDLVIPGCVISGSVCRELVVLDHAILDSVSLAIFDRVFVVIRDTF